MHDGNAPVYWHLQHIMRQILKPIWFLLNRFDRAWNPLRKTNFVILDDYHRILKSTIEKKKNEYSLEELSARKDLISLLIAANAEEQEADRLTEKEIIVNCCG